MKKTTDHYGFWLALLVNLLLHWEGSIPAWILLILHFVIHLSIKWFWLALGAWIVIVLLWMLLWGKICGWAAKCGSAPNPPQKNVNPYSVKSSSEKNNKNQK